MSSNPRTDLPPRRQDAKEKPAEAGLALAVSAMVCAALIWVHATPSFVLGVLASWRPIGCQVGDGMADVQPIIIKKKKGHGHGHHGGAWKLAYADLVTAMMAFFLVMWIIGLDVNTKQGIAAYFSNPGAFKVSFATSRNVLKMDGRPPPAPEFADENDITTKYIDMQAAKTLQLLLQDQVNRDVAFKDRQHNVTFALSDKGLQIDLIDDARRVYFQPESDMLNPAVRPLVLSLGQVLAKSKKPIRIIGHVDGGKVGADPSAKMALGLGRARAIYQALAEGGMPPALCRQVSSRSDHSPKAGSERSSVANNRVTILVPYEPE